MIHTYKPYTTKAALRNGESRYYIRRSKSGDELIEAKRSRSGIKKTFRGHLDEFDIKKLTEAGVPTLE